LGEKGCPSATLRMTGVEKLKGMVKNCKVVVKSGKVMVRNGKIVVRG